jgi:hypothetical protein
MVLATGAIVTSSIIPLETVAATSLAQRPPVVLPSDDESTAVWACWIGHSTVLLRIGGMWILTDPVLFGNARITVSINKKIYQGPASELSEIAVGDISKQFGWNPDHEHRNIKQEMDFLIGTTTLRAEDSSTIQCRHLKHGSDWRLICTNPKGEEIGLLQANKGT